MPLQVMFWGAYYGMCTDKFGIQWMVNQDEKQDGLLGIDFAHGFDPVPGQVEKSGWQTHFIIGQQF